MHFVHRSTRSVHDYANVRYETTSVKRYSRGVRFFLQKIS